MSEIVILQMSMIEAVDVGQGFSNYSKVSLTASEMLERLTAIDPTIGLHAIIIDEDEVELKLDDDGEFKALKRKPTANDMARGQGDHGGST